MSTILVNKSTRAIKLPISLTAEPSTKNFMNISNGVLGRQELSESPAELTSAILPAPVMSPLNQTIALKCQCGLDNTSPFSFAHGIMVINPTKCRLDSATGRRWCSQWSIIRQLVSFRNVTNRNIINIVSILQALLIKRRKQILYKTYVLYFCNLVMYSVC